MEPIVDIHNLTVKYGQKTVLSGITTAVMPGEIRVILGTSGCGKTTLLKAILGLITPTEGAVQLFGEVLGDTDEPQAAKLLQRVGVLFQNGALLGSLTVFQNVALPLQMHTNLPAAIIDDMVQTKLGQVGLPQAGPLFPRELSGGMRKRAALARAVALDPPLLLCDEPSAGLDPVTSAGLDELLLRLRETLGITVVVVTHELRSIQTIADRIIFLHKGTLLFDGTFSDAKVVTSGPIAEFFLRRETTRGHVEHPT